MSNRMSYFGIGLVAGAVLGITAAALCSPQQMRKAGEVVEDKLLGCAARVLNELQWWTMTPRERYAAVLRKSGSLHEWRTQYHNPEHAARS
ncbi:MAG: hypothetical protein PHR43_04325 [Dehalococcoidales bacterium]|nr:hypothetical protein [Dehalococcoidales bacterium]